jgi:hypothetical protein
MDSLVGSPERHVTWFSERGWVNPWPEPGGRGPLQRSSGWTRNIANSRTPDQRRPMTRDFCMAAAAPAFTDAARKQRITAAAAASTGRSQRGSGSRRGVSFRR